MPTLTLQNAPEGRKMASVGNPESKIGFLLSYQDKNSLTDDQFCHLLGVSRAALSSWKCNARNPSETAYRMVQSLSLIQTLAPSIHEYLIK